MDLSLYVHMTQTSEKKKKVIASLNSTSEIKVGSNFFSELKSNLMKKKQCIIISNYIFSPVSLNLRFPFFFFF